MELDLSIKIIELKIGFKADEVVYKKCGLAGKLSF